MSKFDCGNGALWLGDCLELMRSIPSSSVDMVLCDLPYGTTVCAWDTVIPFEPLWREYWRIAKPNAAVVLTASQPFTSALVMSQPDAFKYDWCWNKRKTNGGANAKIQPLRSKEDVCVFYRKQCTYNPQMVDLTEDEIKRFRKSDLIVNSGETFGQNKPFVQRGYYEGRQKFPSNMITINAIAPRSTEGGLHPTQKPVALFEYLIKTYTNPGALVLDNCAGSGTTAIAAQRTGRRWICIEKELVYYLGAAGRIWSECNAPA